MIHFCMVKYGTTVQGRSADELVNAMVTTINNTCNDIKFHLLTERVSDKIPSYVNCIKLSEDDIRDHEHWTKTYFFDPKFIGAKKTDQTIVVDIDMDWNLKSNAPNAVIEYPVHDGEFVSMNRWWRDNEVAISGNFYKFNSHDFKHVATIYKSHWKYFRKYYYETGYCGEPNHGEQYFVYDMVKHSKIVLQPAHWCMKWHKDKHPLYAERFKKETGKDYYKCYYDALWHFVGIK